MHTIQYFLSRFSSRWTPTLDGRYQASRYYAQARNQLDNSALQAFYSSDVGKNFTNGQWAVMWLVGSDIIMKEYLDCKAVGVPIAMARLKVSKADQEDIWNNGLVLAVHGGGFRHTTVPAMRESDICQVFKADGSKRTPEEQIKWLDDLLRPMLEVLENHSIHVKGRTNITPEETAKLLVTYPFPVTSGVLRASADFIDNYQPQE